MSSFILDTNIVIIYARDNDLSNEIENKFQLFSGDNDLYLSIVSLGELDSFMKKNNWGENKRDNIERIVRSINVIGINYGEIISLYGDIDAFSQGKTNTGGTKFSSRNMGKNDLWIAATASHYDLTLMTTDKDFDHLKDEFLRLEFIKV